MSVYFQLFFSFLQIGLFSFGGGYAAMPLIQAQAVVRHGWLTMDAFADLVTIAEMTPGPIALNAATFVGTQVAGLPGALVATAGNVLPSCLIVSLLAWLYGKYRKLDIVQGVLGCLRPAVVAMIASAGVSILVNALRSRAGLDLVMLVLFAVCFVVLRRFKLSPILVILGAGVFGAIWYLCTGTMC